MVKSSLPVATVVAVLIVSVEVFEVGDSERGEKEPVIPAPRSETLSATEELNPFDGFNVTV